jgi:hypothetical protein
VSAAVYLAHEIEWSAARDRARLQVARQHGGSWSHLSKDARHRRTMAEFDAHAATELAHLIERRMAPVAKERSDTGRRDR